ncbi:hypothetical protein GF323_06410 [Candidatus Woesearchaeota archaeon]|nr:hypothetical protein [Candidatus Woesearchaeota archaeon]
MGLFKSNKKNKTDDLDIPPPPPLEGPGKEKSDILNMPHQPQPPQGAPSPAQEQNVLPAEQPAEQKFDIPPMGGEMKGENTLPKQESQPSGNDDSFNFQPPKIQEKDSELSGDKFSTGAAGSMSSVSSEGNKFIEVDKYRQILRDMNRIKKSLKKSDEEIKSLIKESAEEGKIFGSINSTLSSVEQKLIELEESIK